MQSSRVSSFSCSFPRSHHSSVLSRFTTIHSSCTFSIPNARADKLGWHGGGRDVLLEATPDTEQAIRLSVALNASGHGEFALLEIGHVQPAPAISPLPTSLSALTPPPLKKGFPSKTRQDGTEWPHDRAGHPIVTDAHTLESLISSKIKPHRIASASALGGRHGIVALHAKGGVHLDLFRVQAFASATGGDVLVDALKQGHAVVIYDVRAHGKEEGA